VSLWRRVSARSRERLTQALGDYLESAKALGLVK
jgi:hypothetical protein